MIDEEDDDTEEEAYTPPVALPQRAPRAALPIAAPLSATKPLPGYQPHQFSAPAPDSQPFFIKSSAPPPAAPSRSLVKDFARQAWISASEMGSGLLGAASLVDRQLTGNPDTVAWIEGKRRELGDHIASQVQALSPQAQQAYHSSLLGTELFGGKADEKGHIPGPGEVGWGNYLGATLASLIPSALLAVVPQGIVGQVLSRVAGISSRSVAGVAARAGTTGSLFGADQAGTSYEALVDKIDSAKHDDLMQSPVYAEARRQGLSDIDARRMLVQNIAPTMAALQFAVGAATGAGIGQILTRGAVGAAGAGVTRRAAIGGAEGAATMAAQTGGGNVIQQGAEVEAGVRKEFDPAEMAVAFAGGAAGGAVLGAVGGAAHRGRATPAQERSADRATPAPEPNEPPLIASDHQAALSEALNQPEISSETRTLPPPPERLGITYQPDRSQGEGFAVRPSETVPEPAGDIRAQIAALADPENPRDAVYVAKGTRMPKAPDGVTQVIRPEGTLLTNNPAKAALFRRSKVINDTVLAHVLGYPETKAEAIASGDPRVVQGKDEQGNVVAESLVSPQNEGVAQQAAAQQVPLGRVETTTPEAAIARRQAEIVPDTPSVEVAAAQIVPTPPRSEILKKREAEKRRLAGEKPAQQRGFVAPETETLAPVEVAPKTTATVVKRPSRLAREARAEAERQPSVFEPPEGGPTTVVGESAEKPRSSKTTNKDRILADLESKVVNKLMTAAEADTAYGKRPRGPGRQRAFPDFAAWVRDRLAKIEKPEVERALLDKAQALQENRGMPYAQRMAQAREINKQLAHVGPEYAEKLRTMLRELEDPVGAALEGRARPKLKGHPARIDSFYDQRINKPVQDILDRTHDEGKSASVHEYLDAIANDKVIGVRLPQAVALARILKQRLPENLRVLSQETAARHFDRPNMIEPNTLGKYYLKQPGLKQPFITLNKLHDGNSTVETLLHEATHAVTTDYIKTLQKGSPDHKLLSNMAVELHDNIGGRDYLTDTERSALAYAVSDPFELHTMLMTSPVIQRLAAEVRPSQTFVDRMRAVGYNLSPVRTIWQGFTQWVRKVIGLPAGSDTLLDHVLRPIQDITDRATEFNARSGDPLVAMRDSAFEAASHALPRLDRRELVDRIDFKGQGDRARRALLVGATTDDIVQWNRELFHSEGRNLLEDYRAAAEAQGERSKKFRDKYSDRLMGLINKARGPEHETIGRLMNDATLAEAHLGARDPKLNDHLKTPEQRKALADLEARYNQLSDGAKEAYNGLREFYRETYETERTAQLASMIKTALPEATLDQVKALAIATKTMAGIRRLIDNPDSSPVAAAFASAWDNNRALVRAIARVHSQGFTRGDYFPLRRFGDYLVHYGTKGTDDYGVEMFERRSAAEARRLELVRQGAEPSQVLDKRKSNLRTTVPPTVMDELDAAVRHNLGEGEADAVRDMFASIMLQHASRSEAARTRLRRQGVQGASIDLGRVASQDFLATSSRLGYLEHGPDRAQALASMRRHSDWLGRNGAEGEQIRAQAVLNELEQRQPAGDDATGALTGIARKFSTLGFVYSLMSPSHMLLNTMDAHMNSTSLLGARHGYGRSGLALTKALRDIAPVMTKYGARNTLKALGAGLKASDWNLSNVVRDKLIAGGADRPAMMDLFKRLNDAGLIDHSMVREMQRMAHPSRDVTLGWWDRFLDLNTAGAHAVDVANKSAIAKAAYDLELRRTSSHDQATRYALDQVRKTMPNYNVANRARISTAQGPLGGFASPLLQFKQYGIFMYGMMANLTKTSMHGATRAERTEARKALAGVLATHALMAGSLTLIADPLRYIGGAYDYITGEDRPHEYQNDVRRWIADAFGPELGEVVSRGLPHLAGVDLHQRIGLANMLNVPEMKTFDTKGAADVVMQAATGASGQDAAALVGALHSFLAGDVEKGIKDLVPRVIRDPIKAVGLAEKGVTDPKGRTILPKEKLSTADVASQALGFQPSKVSEFREGRYAVLEARQEEQADRSKALNAFIISTPANRKDALAKVQAYNRGHPGSPITYSQLIAGLKRQQQQVQNPATFGLQLSKKSSGRLSREGTFVNQ